MARFVVQTHKEDRHTLPVFESVNAYRFEVGAAGALLFYPERGSDRPSVAYANGEWFTVVSDEDNM